MTLPCDRCGVNHAKTDTDRAGKLCARCCDIAFRTRAVVKWRWLGSWRWFEDESPLGRGRDD